MRICKHTHTNTAFCVYIYICIPYIRICFVSCVAAVDVECYPFGAAQESLRELSKSKGFVVPTTDGDTATEIMEDSDKEAEAESEKEAEAESDDSDKGKNTGRDAQGLWFSWCCSQERWGPACQNANRHCIYGVSKLVPRPWAWLPRGWERLWWREKFEGKGQLGSGKSVRSTCQLVVHTRKHTQSTLS